MLLYPAGKTEPITHSHIEILGNRTTPGWDNYPPRWVMCMLSKRPTLRMWIKMQQFQKTKETKEHFASSCAVLRRCWRCSVLNKMENRTTKILTKKNLKVATWLLCATVNWIFLRVSDNPINVSILYANTAGFTLVMRVKKKHTNIMFSEERDNQKGFLPW